MPVHLPAALASLDTIELVFHVVGALRQRGARSQHAPMDVVLVHGGWPMSAKMATCVLESERVARAVVTHVRAAPFFESVSLAVHPRAALEAPLLLADLRVTPVGRSHLFLDACGPGVGHPSFMARFHDPLVRVLDEIPSRLRKQAVPDWIAPSSGGAGARLGAKPGDGRELSRVLLRYAGAYLDALDAAPPSAEPDANEERARAVASAVKRYGAARRWLERSFGEVRTAQYQRLLWNEA